MRVLEGSVIVWGMSTDEITPDQARGIEVEEAWETARAEVAEQESMLRQLLLSVDLRRAALRDATAREHKAYGAWAAWQDRA